MPHCFGQMHELTEEEVAERCVLNSCPSFDTCKVIGVALKNGELPALPTKRPDYSKVRW